MFYKIENELLTCEICDENGAQLHSLKSKQNGKEYMWYGDPEIWSSQAPILFPIIGRLLDDKFRYNGKEYSLMKHGLSRRMPFKAEYCEGSKAVFVLESDEETLKKYPFEFKLSAAFELIGNSLKNTLTVENRTDGEIYFSLGAHPGFNCKIGDIIEFEKPETVCTERIDKDSYVINQDFPLLDNSREVEITKYVFVPDALILSGLNSKKLRIKGDNELEFTFGDCPFLGIWAKPGAPYVCIEPWWGLDDSRDYKDDISQKRGIQRLDKGGKFEYSWSVEIIK